MQPAANKQSYLHPPISSSVVYTNNSTQPHRYVINYFNPNASPQQSSPILLQQSSHLATPPRLNHINLPDSSSQQLYQVANNPPFAGTNAHYNPYNPYNHSMHSSYHAAHNTNNAIHPYNDNDSKHPTYQELLAQNQFLRKRITRIHTDLDRYKRSLMEQCRLLIQRYKLQCQQR